MRKEFNSQRILLVHQHGRRFIVLEHQYGRRDVMWKRSIDQDEVEAILRACTVSDSNALCAALQMKCQFLNIFISHLFLSNSLIMAPEFREIISVFRCLSLF